MNDDCRERRTHVLGENYFINIERQIAKTETAN